jgi:hypothetical protein
MNMDNTILCDLTNIIAPNPEQTTTRSKKDDLSKPEHISMFLARLFKNRPLRWRCDMPNGLPGISTYQPPTKLETSPMNTVRTPLPLTASRVHITMCGTEPRMETPML